MNRNKCFRFFGFVIWSLLDTLTYISCDRHVNNPVLSEVDTLLSHQQYDSAYSLLQQWHDTEVSPSEADEAYYGLLLTQCQHKLRMYFTSDSIISASLNYYTTHPKEKDKLLRATYYTGMARSDIGHNEEALELSLKAGTMAKELGNKNMEMEAYIYTAYIHGLANNFRQALQYEFKALDIAKATGNKRREGFCYNELCSYYELMG